MNFLQIFFSIVIIAVGVVGGLVSFSRNCLPKFLGQIFCYGKFAEKEQASLINKLEIPKRWFKHFYIFGAPFSATALFLAITRLFFNQKIPECILFVLDFTLGNDRKPTVPSANTLVALTLLTIHIFKRLYETHWISVFSDAKINVAHYIMGFVHYLCVITVIFGESEGFVKGSDVNLQNSLKVQDWFAILMFIWMTYQQFRSNIILANLRKNQKGVVVTKGYKLPEGGLFEYISAPLQFTEIGIYGALQIILSESSTYTFIYFWVVVNQLTCAVFSHQWSKKTFKNYPPSRKIIIPFLL